MATALSFLGITVSCTILVQDWSAVGQKMPHKVFFHAELEGDKLASNLKWRPGASAKGGVNVAPFDPRKEAGRELQCTKMSRAEPFAELVPDSAKPGRSFLCSDPVTQRLEIILELLIPGYETNFIGSRKAFRPAALLACGLHSKKTQEFFSRSHNVACH